MKPLVLASVLTVLVFASGASALEVSDITVADSVTVHSSKLILNGAGLRKVGFVITAKIYVAALYLERKMNDTIEIMADAGPKRLEFIFMRDLMVKEVKEAWTFQFNESVSEKYPELQTDLAQLLTFMESIKEGDKHSFEIEDDVTRFYLNQTLKGQIKGHGFQKAFLSIWIGKKPAQDSLKEALLGQDS